MQDSERDRLTVEVCEAVSAISPAGSHLATTAARLREMVGQEVPAGDRMSDRHELQSAGTHPAPCARHCESTAYEIEIRRLRADRDSWAQQAADRAKDALDLVAAERERCAKLCDDARAAIWDYHDKQVRDTAETVCINLAARIRGA